MKEFMISIIRITDWVVDTYRQLIRFAIRFSNNWLKNKDININTNRKSLISGSVFKELNH